MNFNAQFCTIKNKNNMLSTRGKKLIAAMGQNKYEAVKGAIDDAD